MFRLLLLSCCVLLVQLPKGVFAADHAPENEIAVLIDVSGSMKHNDPQNLRIPALKLLINLLPAETTAGVWLFAEETSVLVASGVVDAQWKKQALEAVSKVHSRGQFTNIETALQTATQSWLDKPSTGARNVLLLTDGVVDVAKDKQQNTASKERIVAQLLPKIEQTGAHIQTIALSKQADSELLKKLAFSTKGWSETVESAQKLERIFLKMFKQAVPQNSVPLVGNKFKIDASIKEFSVLVFKKPGTVTELLSANKQKITKDTHSDQIHWMSEKNYDLMTIKNPLIGEWQILGEIDPDNQVMVLTDLSLDVNELPLYKSGLEPLVLEAHFSDQKNLIDRDDFLKLITIHAQQIDSAGLIKEYPLKPLADRKGYFQTVLSEPLAKGNYTFKILADGKTFTREITRNIALIESPILLKSSVDRQNRQVTLNLTPDVKLIDPNTLTLNATILQIMHDPESLPISKKGEVWEIVLEAPKQGEQKIVNFEVTAKTKQGDVIQPELQPFLIDDQLFADAAQKTEQTNTNKGTETQQEAVINPEVPKANWLMTALMTVAINIVLIALGYWAYLRQKKLAAKKQAHLLERLA